MRPIPPVTKNSDGAIGGYFALELPLHHRPRYPQARKFQSARAAFLALLRAGKPKRIWLPRYICDEMLAVLVRTGVECLYYSLTPTLEPGEDLTPSPDDWLLWVNYFGLCDALIEPFLDKMGAERIVIDNSQAFFSPPRSCLATIYSPRKFFGVPDGGLLVTEFAIRLPENEDQLSLTRSAHLLKRLAGPPESGYGDFKAAENSLIDAEPLQMSRLTDGMLSAIDYEQVRLQRNRNFALLHHETADLNHLAIDTANVDGPLCYPLLLRGTDIRPALLARRIFVATYWPEVLARVEAGSIESALVNTCIPLPCDQRYDISHLLHVADSVRALARDAG